MATIYDVAKRAGVSTYTVSSVINQSAYVSPEQASGDPDLDARSDVYSLACVAFEMLAGRPPFGGENTEQIVSRRFHEAPPPLRTSRPSPYNWWLRSPTS